MLDRFRSRIKEIRQQRQLERDLQLIESSGLFEKEWYLQKYPDAVQAGVDPVSHFLNYGGFEGHNPGPDFFSSWYLEKYDDVRENGINPLVHYLKYGRKEGRNVSPPLFKLRRMYDYSRETNRIVFEEPPERIHVQRPNVVGNFSGHFEGGEVLCPRPYVSVLEDAVIFGGRNPVLVEGKFVLSDEMVDFQSPEFGAKLTDVEPVNDGEVRFTHYKKIDVHVNEAVLISCGYDNNYFHWLVECLPKVLLIDSLPEFKEAPLLIPTGLHKNLLTALERVNTNKRELIFIEPDAVCQVNRLIFPSALSQVLDRYEGTPAFNTDSVVSPKWLPQVSEYLKAGGGSTEKPWRKLFLTRRNGHPLLENWEQMELVLVQYGFEIVQLEEVSLDFQVELFSRAAVIVAPDGTGLTNMLFCQPGIKVIVLVPNDEGTNYYFWSNLGAVNNLDVTIIAGERLLEGTNSALVHESYVVDPGLVLEEIHKYEQSLIIDQPAGEVEVVESSALLDLQEIPARVQEAILRFIEIHTKSDSWASSPWSIQFIRDIRVFLLLIIKSQGLDPEKDEFLLRLAFVLSSPHIVDYFYYRSGEIEIASARSSMPADRVRASLFVLQCLTQPSFRINYQDIETLLDYQNLWPLIISKGVEYRFFFNRLSDLEAQLDFLRQNIKTFIDYLNGGKFTDFKQYLRWYVASPPIGFSVAAREIYELYRVMEQDTLVHSGESLPPFQRRTEKSQEETVVRVGFLFLSMLSGVESTLVLKTLECVPENYQIFMIGLNDQEYPPEIESDLAERKIQLALLDQSSVAETLASLRSLNLDVLFYCAPFWGSFLSRIAVICAARAAPVQISYIGDVITSGLPTCDYFVLPPMPDRNDMQARFTEQLMIVPNRVQFLFNPPRKEEKVSSWKNKDHIVYFSHAHMWKLNGDLLDVWAQILSQVDGALIRLAPFKSSYHKSYLPVLQEFIVKKCRKWGVSAARFEIIHDAGASLMQKQLANADVYLDSFPYTGATSLFEVLAESLPLVSLAGESYPELLSTIVLHQFDLEEDTVALSREVYVAKAVALGKDAAMRNEVSLKIKKKVAETSEQLDKTEVFSVFWAEIDKWLRQKQA